MAENLAYPIQSFELNPFIRADRADAARISAHAPIFSENLGESP
jgi:hypothetical protein